jgi:hypothetical protein
VIPNVQSFEEDIMAHDILETGDETDIPFELEEIVVGNMPFSLRDYENAGAGGDDEK